MKSNYCNRVRMLSGMFAATLAILMILSATSAVFGQEITTPTMNVGDSAYFGGISDIRDDYQDEMDEALREYRDMGFDVEVDARGGTGAYMGWEVMSNDADINGYQCYDVSLMGAVAIDFGMNAKVKGTVSEEGMTMSVDAKADGFIKGEATLNGHLYLTVDELAVAKLQFTIEADAEFEANVDATVNYFGEPMTMDASASGKVDSASISVMLEFDPPIDIYQFPITQGEVWYVPHVDTAVTGTITASGSVSYTVDSVVTGEEPYRDSKTYYLADEIGDNNFSDIIPGGEPEYYWGYPMGGGTKFTCTQIAGDIFTVEMDMFGMMDSDSMFPGTRQFNPDPSDMMPSMGLQFDRNKGMMSGMAVNGEPMTQSVPKSEVESFIQNPLGTVTAETGGSSGASNTMMMMLLLVVVTVVVVLVVVMVVMKGKKAPPATQPQPYLEPEQQMYGPQPGYEQPPPEYPPPEYPPSEPAPAPDQYPPPPPPGQ